MNRMNPQRLAIAIGTCALLTVSACGSVTSNDDPSDNTSDPAPTVEASAYPRDNFIRITSSQSVADFVGTHYYVQGRGIVISEGEDKRLALLPVAAGKQVDDYLTVLTDYDGARELCTGAEYYNIDITEQDGTVTYESQFDGCGTDESSVAGVDLVRALATVAEIDDWEGMTLSLTDAKGEDDPETTHYAISGSTLTVDTPDGDPTKPDIIELTDAQLDQISEFADRLPADDKVPEVDFSETDTRYIAIMVGDDGELSSFVRVAQGDGEDAANVEAQLADKLADIAAEG